MPGRIQNWSADSHVRAFLASDQVHADKAVRSPLSAFLESALGAHPRIAANVAAGLLPAWRNKFRAPPSTEVVFARVANMYRPAAYLRRELSRRRCHHLPLQRLHERQIDQAGLRNTIGNRQPREVEPPLATIEDYAVGRGDDLARRREDAVGIGHQFHAPVPTRF